MRLEAKLDREKIKNLIIKQGLTYGDLAERMGVSRQFVYQIMSEDKPRKPSTIRNLAQALGVEIEEILE